MRNFILHNRYLFFNIISFLIKAFNPVVNINDLDYAATADSHMQLFSHFFPLEPDFTHPDQK